MSVDTAFPLSLDKLRVALPDIIPPEEGCGPTWGDLQHQAKHERGLFKVLALYVKDKLEKRDTKVRLYSAFPFPNRAERELDDFQAKALGPN